VTAREWLLVFLGTCALVGLTFNETHGTLQTIGTALIVALLSGFLLLLLFGGLQ